MSEITDGKMRPDVRHHPEPPLGLAELEQTIMADVPGASVMIDREGLRALLRYVRRLERDVAEGGFW